MFGEKAIALTKLIEEFSLVMEDFGKLAVLA